LASNRRKAVFAPKMQFGAFRRSSRLNSDMRDKVQPLTPNISTRTSTLTPVLGTTVWPGLFSRSQQEGLRDELRGLIAQNPFYRTTMPRTGRPLSVSMTNMGELGWVSDQAGYRYEATHPVTKKAWPAIPATLLRLWNDLTDYPAPPQACLVNHYRAGARMGLHQDRDETALDAPVLSLSLGDTALFRLGGTERSDPTQSFKLESGDLMILGGPSRLRFHGVDRILPGSSTLLAGGGRLNLTLRRVTPAPD